MKSAANVVVLILMAVSAIVVAQNPPASPPTPAVGSETKAEAAKPPEPAIAAELERLQQFASQATQTIAGLHIESWKTSSTAKERGASQCRLHPSQPDCGIAGPDRGCQGGARGRQRRVQAVQKRDRAVRSLRCANRFVAPRGTEGP